MRKDIHKPTKAEREKAKERFVATGNGITITRPNKNNNTTKKGK